MLFGIIQSKAQFVESAENVGINHVYRNSQLIGGGVAIFDVNNDDLLDLYIVGGDNNSALYINNGTSFDKNITYLGIDDIDYYAYKESAVAVGDINNDGFDDLFICTHQDYENFILVNKGDNTFDVLPSDVSGISDIAWSIGASFGDINKDGHLDIFTVNYIKEILIETDSVGNSIFMHEGYANFLYLNNGDNTFEDMSEGYGIHKLGTSLASSFTDFDNDNDVDIYVANDFGAFIVPNELYENRFPEFAVTDESVSSGADIGLFGMGIAVGDYDNDLDLDYYVTNLGKNELLQNNGNKTFTLVTNAAMVGDSAVGNGGLKVGWGTGFMDYDNNGWLDIFVSNGYISAAPELENPNINPNAFFENNKDGTFTFRSRDIGIQDNGFCRGAAYGDLDNDGDLDLVFVPVNKVGTVPQGIRPNVEVYYNETVNNNNWIKLKLQGTVSNYNGYGSHVLLHSSDGNTQLREVDGGSSHASSNSSIVHFGLSNATVDSIEIFWTNGTYQVEYNLSVNQQHVLIEGETIVSSMSNYDISANISIYPNPVLSNAIISLENITIDSRNLYYLLNTLDGKTIMKQDIIDFPFKISLDNISRQELVLNIFNGNINIGSRLISRQ